MNALADKIRLLEALKENKLFAYKPYPKQLEFHANGAKFRERGFFAANQSGKTYSAGYETAAHLNGRYPEWWPGRKFRKPVRWWAGGPSAELVRDTIQKILLGGDRPEDYGTGTIPKDDILDVKQSRGVTGAVAQIFVKHISGGKPSVLTFKNYEQDRDKWQGDSIDGLWCDEEPPLKHYKEGLTRTNARDGIVYLTLTPLKGMTDTVALFYPLPTTADRALTQMTIDDVMHYTPRQRQQIIDSYEEFEREARTMGIPMMGEGRVFDVPESELRVTSFDIPSHWPVMGAIDFGYGNHPTGCVAGAWDRDSDTIYITHAYKAINRMPEQMAVEMRHWYTGMPWAWPHDGHKIGDRNMGLTESGMYRRAGIRMLREHATFPDGGHSFEAGVKMMLERMRTGRFKVFAHLEPWWNEYRIYHRKDGLVVKERDDLMSASRVFVMAHRCARTIEDGRKWPKQAATYDPLEWGEAS